MKIDIKGFEVWLGADMGANNYTLSIPKLKIFKTYNIPKNAIAILEQKANEIINEKQSHDLQRPSPKL